MLEYDGIRFFFQDSIPTLIFVSLFRQELQRFNVFFRTCSAEFYSDVKSSWVPNICRAWQQSEIWPKIFVANKSSKKLRTGKLYNLQFSVWNDLVNLKNISINTTLICFSAPLEATGKIHQSEGFGRLKLRRSFIGEPWKAMKISWASQIKKLYVWPANWQPYYRTVREVSRLKGCELKSEWKHWRFRRLHFLINRMSIVSEYPQSTHITQMQDSRATAVQEVNELAEAQRLHRQVWEERQETLGADHLETWLGVLSATLKV